ERVRAYDVAAPVLLRHVLDEVEPRAVGRERVEGEVPLQDHPLHRREVARPDDLEDASRLDRRRLALHQDERPPVAAQAAGDAGRCRCTACGCEIRHEPTAIPRYGLPLRQWRLTVRPPSRTDMRSFQKAACEPRHGIPTQCATPRTVSSACTNG